MNNTSIYIELDGVEFEIEFEYSYYYQPAKLFAAPEDCYPEEEEFTYEVFIPTYWLNAIEAWELSMIDEAVYWGAAFYDMEESRLDVGCMWDVERDYLIDKDFGC